MLIKDKSQGSQEFRRKTRFGCRISTYWVGGTALHSWISSFVYFLTWIGVYCIGFVRSIAQHSVPQCNSINTNPILISIRFYFVSHLTSLPSISFPVVSVSQTLSSPLPLGVNRRRYSPVSHLRETRLRSSSQLLDQLRLLRAVVRIEKTRHRACVL